MSNTEILSRAFRGTELLAERQKSIIKEHTERRKKLLGLMRACNKAEMTAGQAGLDIETISLSPELSDLLENPAHGL